MQSIEVSGLAVAFAAAAPVLDDVSFRLSPGFYGVVGANGAGKTTLLRVLAGELVADAGSVVVRPPGARVVLCPQEVTAANEAIRRFAEEPSQAPLRGRLKLVAEDLARWSTLSPGERKRWQIGAALAAEPDVLLLDEPTNHLDAGGRALLVNALGRFAGVGLVVSHDRALLDELPRATLRVHETTVTLYEGGLSRAMEAWSGERRAAEEAHASARAKVGAIARRLDAATRNQEGAAKSRSSRHRMKDAHDHDARGALAKGLAAFAEKRAGKDVNVLRASLARAERDVPAMTKDRTLGGSVFAQFARAPWPTLFHLDAPAVHARSTSAEGEAPVILREVHLAVGREERLRITGPNGAGKTTLLEALVRSRPDPRVLYLPQELPREVTATGALMEEVLALEPATRGRVLSVFAALGSDPARLLHRGEDARGEGAGALSPGEARKLWLAFALGNHAVALVLDEPTNHLDLPTVERLEAALEQYPGCIVLVTHDDRFARAASTRTLEVRNGVVHAG